MDVFTTEERSRIMGRVKGRDTKPEMVVRRLLHSMGFRFRLHVRSLPGTPDIVLPCHKKIVQVHGCFWHRHEKCPRATTPQTNTEFWKKKISANKLRDRRSEQRLRRMGWGVMTVWECQTRDIDRIGRRLRRFLDNQQ